MSIGEGLREIPVYTLILCCHCSLALAQKNCVHFAGATWIWPETLTQTLLSRRQSRSGGQSVLEAIPKPGNPVVRWRWHSGALMRLPRCGISAADDMARNATASSSSLGSGRHWTGTTSCVASTVIRAAAITRNTSTSCTTSTPLSRPTACAPRSRWACGTCHRKPGRSTAAGVLAANIAADLTAWARLPGFHDCADLRLAARPPSSCLLVPPPRPARPRHHDCPGQLGGGGRVAASASLASAAAVPSAVMTSRSARS